MQTQQEGKLTIVGQSISIVRKQGFLALYSGLSASILRQLTYSTTRFGLYEVYMCINFLMYVCFYANDLII